MSKAPDEKPKAPKKAEVKECKHIDVCNAPICPMDEESLIHCVWYPDEEICRSRKFTSMTFIKKQRLVAERAGDPTKYFSCQMLNRNFIVREGITGIDPDQEIGEASRAERRWIGDHPERKRSSEKVTTKRRSWMKRMRKASATKTGSESSRTIKKVA